MDLFKKYLLASVATFAPPGEGGGGPNEGDLDGQEDQGLPEGEEGDAPLEGDVPESDEGTLEAEGKEGDDQGQVDPEPQQPESRRNKTIRELRARVHQESTERQRIDRELQEIRAEARARQQQTQQESPEAKAARRALMDPLEVMREDVRDSEQRMQNMLHQQAVSQQEAQDKLSYNSILRDAPQLKKYDAEVEKVRLEQQARGVFVPREVLLDLAIGRAARASAAKAAPRAAAQGRQRVAQQQSRPAQARGDTATQRGRQGDSVEKRLENVPI